MTEALSTSGAIPDLIFAAVVLTVGLIAIFAAFHPPKDRP